MKDTKFRILLDIHEVRSQVTIPVKVGDVSCKIYITLVEGGKPYKIHENSFGVFTGKKGDDNYLFNNCVIENGVIRYDFTPQTVAASGILECEVRIYDEDGGVLTTPSFTIVVDERAVKDSDLASGTEFTFLDEIIVNEGQRMENERNRIEAFNNMELTVEDKGDNYLLTKTNKDGSKEEFPIGKGEDYEITPEDYQAIADKVVKDNLDSQAEEYFESLDARATEFLEDVKNQNKNYIDEATEVTATATGKAITIESANAPLQSLKLFGSTTQDGTPTPDAPKELKSVGDSGSFEVGVYGKNLCDPNSFRSNGGNGSANTFDTTTYTITMLENAVNSTGRYIALSYPFEIGKDYTLSFDIKGTSGRCVWGGFDHKYVTLTLTNQFKRYSVTFTPITKNQYLVFYSDSAENGGLLSGEYMQFANVQIEEGTQTPYEPCNKQSITFTDTLRGVGDIKDEVDFARGITTQRFGIVDLGTLTWYYNGQTGIHTYYSSYPTVKPAGVSVCAKYKGVTSTTTFLNEQNVIYLGNISQPQSINVRTDVAYADVNAFKSAMSGTMLIYELATPIETPISERELNDYRHLMTNKGNTTFISEADMEISYYINKPNAQAIGNLHTQINKDYFKLQQAIISTGGN